MQPLSPETDNVVRRTIRVASGAEMRVGGVDDQGVRLSANASGLWAGELRCEERLTRYRANVASGAGMRAGWVADQGVRWSAKATGLWTGELRVQERLTR